MRGYTCLAAWAAWWFTPAWALAADADANTQPMSFDPDLAIFTAVVFALLLAVLYKFAWRRIADGLATREEGIAHDIEAAEKANRQAQDLLAQYKEQLARATSEVEALLEKGRREAEEQSRRIVAEAQSQSQRDRQRALAEIEAAKGIALQELAQFHIDHAVALAGRIVGEKLTADDHARLIQESLQKFPSTN